MDNHLILHVPYFFRAKKNVPFIQQPLTAKGRDKEDFYPLFFQNRFFQKKIEGFALHPFMLAGPLHCAVGRPSLLLRSAARLRFPFAQ